MHPFRELAVFIIIALKVIGVIGVIYGTFSMFILQDPSAIAFGFMIWLAGWGLDALFVAIFGAPTNLRSN